MWATGGNPTRAFFLTDPLLDLCVICVWSVWFVHGLFICILVVTHKSKSNLSFFGTKNRIFIFLLLSSFVCLFRTTDNVKKNDRHNRKFLFRISFRVSFRSAPIVKVKKLKLFSKLDFWPFEDTKRPSRSSKRLFFVSSASGARSPSFNDRKHDYVTLVNATLTPHVRDQHCLS